MSRLHRAVAAALLAVVLSVAASVVWMVGLGRYPAAWTVAGLVVTGSLIGIASVRAIRVPAPSPTST